MKNLFLNSIFIIYIIISHAIKHFSIDKNIPSSILLR